MNKMFIENIENSKKIAIISHINPDADALCSSFALKNIIKDNFKDKFVDVYADGNIGSLYDPILRNEVINPTPYNSYDMAIVLDCPNIERTGKFANLINNTPFIANIDHHNTNNKFGAVNFVSDTVSSTCEIIYHIAKASQYKISDLVAKEIYQGIITDTNFFSSIATNQKTHQVVSELLKYNFDHDAIKVYYFKNNSKEKIMLLSKAIMSMKFHSGDLFTTMRITNDTYNKYGGNFDNTLGIIDSGINMSGTEISAILIETEPNKVYVSLRSKGKVNVGEIAKIFSGGGSECVAAFQHNGDLKELEKKLVEVVTPYLKDLKADADETQMF